MSNFFNPNNGFFSVMGKMFDVFLLNLVWTITMLPELLFLFFAQAVYASVVEAFGYIGILGLGLIGLICSITFVPATSALYYTIVKNIRKDRDYAIKQFFHAFGLNFRQGMLFSLLFALVMELFFIDFTYVFSLLENGDQNGSLLVGVFIVLAVFFAFLLVYLPPVLSRFKNTFSKLLKTSLYMAVRHFPTTLLLVLIWGFTVLAVWFTDGLMLFILPGAMMLVSSFLIEKIFKRYMPKKEDADREHPEEDHWYLE